MKQRAVVIGLATAGTAALAGCSAPVGTKDLDSPDRRKEDSETQGRRLAVNNLQTVSRGPVTLELYVQSD